MNESLYAKPSAPHAWIENLPHTIASQAAVLQRLLDVAEADDRIRAFRIRGSVARGTADEYSDLDTRMWISDDEYEEMLASLPDMVRTIGPTLDILFETPGSPYLFVQYTTGVQLELSTARASDSSDRDRGVVVPSTATASWVRRTPNPRQPGTRSCGWAGRGWRSPTWISTSVADRFGRL